MNPRLSQRAETVPASPIRKLTPLADAAKARGIHVYHLNIGQPDIETAPEMLARLHGIEDRIIEYTPSCGTVEFIDAMRAYYRQHHIELARNEILSTTGGSEAISFAMLGACDVGDEVIVVEPFYTNYAGFAAMTDVKLVPVTSHVDDGFRMPPLEAFRLALTDRTRMVILCNPNNPTGTVYTDEELLGVAAFCRENGLFLLGDEVYREFTYDGREARSLLTLEGFEDLVIVADSLSKRYSACGIRLGAFISRNRDLYESVLRMAQARLSAPGIAQKMAAGLATIDPEYHRRIVVEYEKRRDTLFRGLSSIEGVFLRKPEGAFYCIAKLPVEDTEAFAAWLLTEFNVGGHTVMITPARGFYMTPGLGHDEARIAYVLGCEALERSIDILRQALEAYRGIAAVARESSAVR